MIKLPYEFDLLYDIKTQTDLHSKLMDGYAEGFELLADVEMLMEKHSIPFPEKYIRKNKPGFPVVVWVDHHGSYLVQKPEDEEMHKYQRMKAF